MTAPPAVIVMTMIRPEVRDLDVRMTITTNEEDTTGIGLTGVEGTTTIDVTITTTDDVTVIE
jgi:hypothetical protein